MKNKEMPRLIADDLISLKPMEFKLVNPVGMVEGGKSFWSTLTISPTIEKTKIIKVKEWLSAKKINIAFSEISQDIISRYTQAEISESNKDMFSRYAQKQINHNYYGTIKI